MSDTDFIQYQCYVCRKVYTTGLETILFTGKPKICPLCFSKYGNKDNEFDLIPGLDYENKNTKDS